MAGIKTFEVDMPEHMVAHFINGSKSDNKRSACSEIEVKHSVTISVDRVRGNSSRKIQIRPGKGESFIIKLPESNSILKCILGLKNCRVRKKVGFEKMLGLNFFVKNNFL